MRARDLLMNLEEHADGLKFLIRDPDAVSGHVVCTWFGSV